jgi:hypothetical protein
MPEQVDDQLWTATVGNGILYTELVKDGSPTFSIENDGSTLTRAILVLWEELDYAKNAFLGYPQIVGEGGNTLWLSRNVPDAATIFTNSANRPYLYATKVSGQGYGMPVGASAGIHDEDTNFPIYRYAKLEVTYETLTYDILSDEQMFEKGFIDGLDNPDESTLARYVTVETHPGVEYLTLPQGGFSFVGPVVSGKPAPVPGGPGKITPNYDLTLTWHLVPREAVGSILYNPYLQNPPIDQCLGTVNSKPFPSKPNAKYQSLQYANVVVGGSSYNAGDLLVVVGGTGFPGATVRVTAVDSSGAVTGLAVVGRGLYTSTASSPNPLGGGTGSGATANLTFGAGFPVGSLLMVGCEIKPIRSTSGDRLYDLVYRFKFLPQGNQFLYYQGTSTNQYSDAGYFEVSTNGTSNIGGSNGFNNVSAQPPVNIYPWADHTALFRVPS